MYSQDLVPVTAPVGAIVDELPTSRSYEMIDDVGYHIYNDVYYVRTEEGRYRVVESPSSDMQEAAEIVSIEDKADSVIVHIPNSRDEGSTAIILTKSEGGFVGPQGEFYSEFPNISQLKVMYGK